MNRKEIYVDNLLISLIENWNDENPKSKLCPELICNISLHLDHAYTIGVEDTLRKNNMDYSDALIIIHELTKQSWKKETLKN